MYWMLAAVLMLLIDQASKRRVLARCAGNPPRGGHGRPVIRVVENDRLVWGLARKRRWLLALWIGCGAVIFAMTLADTPPPQVSRHQ